MAVLYWWQFWTSRLHLRVVWLMSVVAVEVLSVGLWLVTTSSSTDEIDRQAAAWGPTNLPNKGG
jgi:hypothetical protein